MGIAITFRHMASSESLKSYVHEKFERVQKYLRQPLEAHVTLFVESREHCAEAGITSGGRHYHARHDSEDMYKSIDALIDKIEQQISRHHDTVARNKKGANSAREIAASDEPRE
jgi:putative sigma-54 modulation protein